MAPTLFPEANPRTSQRLPVIYRQKMHTYQLSVYFSLSSVWHHCDLIDVIDTAVRLWHNFLRACVKAKSRHFGHRIIDYRKTSHRSSRLLIVQMNRTPGLYAEPGVYPEPSFYHNKSTLCYFIRKSSSTVYTRYFIYFHKALKYWIIPNK